MTNEEAITVLTKLLKLSEMVNEDKTSESLRRAIPAIEKATPMKPADITRGSVGVDLGCCPVCKKKLNAYDNYCRRCGQNLDWRDISRDI